VRTFLYPAVSIPVTQQAFQDQFAFRPTGPTEAVLIVLLHTINEKLTDNQYVRVFALDFSKAFDSVRHSKLLEKYADLDIPAEIYNWLRHFLEGHSH
jgi:hypothetical protein